MVDEQKQRVRRKDIEDGEWSGNRRSERVWTFVFGKGRLRGGGTFETECGGHVVKAYRKC